MPIYSKLQLPSFEEGVSIDFSGLMERNNCPIAFIDGQKKPKPNTAFKRHSGPISEVVNHFKSIQFLSLGRENVCWKAIDVQDITCVVVLSHAESHKLFMHAQFAGGVLTSDFVLQWVDSGFKPIFDIGAQEDAQRWEAIKSKKQIPEVGSVLWTTNATKLIYLGKFSKTKSSYNPSNTLHLVYVPEAPETTSIFERFQDYELYYQSICKMEESKAEEATDLINVYKGSIDYAVNNSLLKCSQISNESLTRRLLSPDAKYWNATYPVYIIPHETVVNDSAGYLTISELLRHLVQEKLNLRVNQFLTTSCELVESEEGEKYISKEKLDTPVGFNNRSPLLQEVSCYVRQHENLFIRAYKLCSRNVDLDLEFADVWHPSLGQIACADMGVADRVGRISCYKKDKYSLHIEAEHEAGEHSSSWLWSTLCANVLLHLRDKDVCSFWSSTHKDLVEVPRVYFND